MKVIAIIVAAGISSRFNHAMPKVYLELGGKPIIKHSVDTFTNVLGAENIVCVINEAHVDCFNQAFLGANIPLCVFGGNVRHESVKKGLNIAKDLNATHVLIHDAARPLVSERIINDVIKAFNNNAKAVDVLLPIFDTIRRVQAITANSYTGQKIDRNNVYAAQTPQGFLLSYLLELIANRSLHHDAEYTDEISLVLNNQHDFQLVYGDIANMKLTLDKDLETMSKYILR